VQRLRALREQLENKPALKSKKAERQYDLNRAAELKYGKTHRARAQAHVGRGKTRLGPKKQSGKADAQRRGGIEGKIIAEVG